MTVRLRTLATTSLLLAALHLPGARAAAEPDVAEDSGAGVSAAGDQAGYEARHASRLGIRLGSKAPMTIQADALEAVQEEGAERVVFLKNVEVLQEDLRITCDWLEALYAPDSPGGPTSIHAKGNVRLHQAGTDATCTSMYFDRAAGFAVCSGEEGWAVLRRDKDVVEGKRIEFDLRNSVVKVRGGARVRVQFDDRSARKTQAVSAAPENFE